MSESIPNLFPTDVETRVETLGWSSQERTTGDVGVPFPSEPRSRDETQYSHSAIFILEALDTFTDSHTKQKLGQKFEELNWVLPLLLPRRAYCRLRPHHRLVLSLLVVVTVVSLVFTSGVKELK
ncbi:hypothetical protein LINPERHAP1_LOCUS16965 [Linum perenne]